MTSHPNTFLHHPQPWEQTHSRVNCSPLVQGAQADQEGQVPLCFPPRHSQHFPSLPARKEKQIHSISLISLAKLLIQRDRAQNKLSPCPSVSWTLDSPGTSLPQPGPGAGPAQLCLGALAVRWKQCSRGIVIKLPSFPDMVTVIKCIVPFSKGQVPGESLTEGVIAILLLSPYKSKMFTIGKGLHTAGTGKKERRQRVVSNSWKIQTFGPGSPGSPARPFSPCGRNRHSRELIWQVVLDKQPKDKFIKSLIIKVGKDL